MPSRTSADIAPKDGGAAAPGLRRRSGIEGDDEGEHFSQVLHVAGRDTLVWSGIGHNVRDLRTPFGGVKAGGVGHEGVTHSLELYSQSRIVPIGLGATPGPRWGVATTGGTPPS